MTEQTCQRPTSNSQIPTNELALGVGGWELEVDTSLASIGSGVARRFMFTITTAAALVLGGSTSAFACPVCFGAEETAMIDGTRLGIAALLAITLAVQGAFAGFFFYLRKRAKQIADIELETEWSELQGGASRS